MGISLGSALVLYKYREQMKRCGERHTLKRRMIGVLASCRKGVDHSHQMMSSSTWVELGISFLYLWIREGRGTYEEQTSYHV
jgi:hypothetical protein